VWEAIWLGMLLLLVLVSLFLPRDIFFVFESGRRTSQAMPAVEPHTLKISAADTNAERNAIACYL